MSDHKTLAEALAAFQAEAPKLHKGASAEIVSKRTGGKYSYKYLDHADLVEEVKELMGKHGLSFSGMPCFGPNGQPALRYVLRHTSGDSDGDVMPLMVADSVTAQEYGSGLSYGRRYAQMAALNLVADADDDGAAASAARARPQQQRQQSNGVDFRAAATGLKGSQIREAFVSCGLQPPGGEVPTWMLFNDVPADKAALLAEALKGIER